METWRLCLIWGGHGRCQLSAKKRLSPGEEVPDFTGTRRVLQFCTLSSVISHKASLILHQEQLRGLWLEIKRCTIHFLCITSLIIHLNCSERLSRAKCQARCWLGMCRHVHVKGRARESTTERQREVCVCMCLSIGSHRVQWYEGKAELVTERPDILSMSILSRCVGLLQSSVPIAGGKPRINYTVLQIILNRYYILPEKIKEWGAIEQHLIIYNIQN